MFRMLIPIFLFRFYRLVEFQHVDIQNGKILCLKLVLLSLQKIIFASSQFYDVL